MPPTPTPMPTGTEIINITESYSLWGSVSTAVQTWHWLGSFGLVIQLIILVFIVMAGMFVVSRFVKEFTRKDAES